jgi:hypothetical protein
MRMKSKLDPDTTPEQKMERFHSALKHVVSVSHKDFKKELVKDEKARRLRKDKPGPRSGSD